MIDVYNFKGDNYYCMGNKEENSHLEDDGAIILPWKKERVFDEDTAKLRLNPTIRQLNAIKNRIPNGIKALSKLECLEIPLVMLENVIEGDLPTNIRYLLIVGTPGSVYQSKINWSAIEKLPYLEELFFLKAFNADAYIQQFINFDINNFKKLKYIRFDCVHEGNLIKNISPNHSIEEVYIHGVKDFHLFDVVPSHLKRLSIIGANKNFEFNKIVQLEELEYVFINSLKCEIDCRLFKNMKSLKSIYILNSKKILHPEVFIEKNHIESLQFVSCGGAFKKLINQIDPKDYTELSIEYS